MGLAEELEKIDGKTVSLALSTALSLIRYGTQLLEDLSDEKSDEELLVLISQYRSGSKEALDELDKSIADREKEEASTEPKPWIPASLEE